MLSSVQFEFPPNLSDEEKFLYVDKQLMALDTEYRTKKAKLLEIQKPFKPKFVQSVQIQHQGKFHVTPNLVQHVGPKSYVVETKKRETGTKKTIQKYLNEWLQTKNKAAFERTVNGFEQLLQKSQNLDEARRAFEWYRERLDFGQFDGKQVMNYIWSSFKTVTTKTTLKRKAMTKQEKHEKKIKSILSSV